MEYSTPFLLLLLLKLLYISDLQNTPSSGTSERFLNWTLASDAGSSTESDLPLNWTRLASKNFTRLVKAVKKVAESHSVEVFMAQVNEPENDNHFIANLFDKVGPIIITVRNSTRAVEPLAKLVVVVVEDDLNVRDLIDSNFTDSIWNPTNYYIVVTASNPPDLLELFQDLWNVYFVSNVIFYFTDGSEVVNVYNPFKNATDVTSINLKNIRAIKKAITKKMNDLNGYPLRVSIFPVRLKANPLGNGSFSGPDGVILATLAKKMNFRPITFAPSDGKRYGYRAENGTFTGVLGDLIYDRADISFNSAFIKDYETTRVQFTRPIDFDKLCLVVAKAGLRPHWKGMFLAFSAEMWAAVFFTFSFSITFWSCLRKINYGKSSVGRTVLDLYQIFIMLPITRVPVILSERIAIVSFLWFSLSTTTIFQGSMVRFLSYPSYEPDINTLHEVAERNYPILTGSQNLQETFDSDELLMRRLLENFQVLKDKSVDSLTKVAAERNAAALGRMNDLEEKIASRFVKNNIVLLHIVAECPRSYHSGYMLPYDSPFLESINRVISVFVESGIIHSWYIHSTPFRPLSDYHQFQETYKPLTMKNVVIAFFICLIGLGIGVVAFGLEFVAYRFSSDEERVVEVSGRCPTLDGKLHRRSRIVYQTTRLRFKLLKVA